jgi:malic enzyme
MSDNLKEAALEYHRMPTPGKISVNPTKPMATQRDLALAYSPGVAEACLAIVEDPLQAAELTARSNLVAVVTNGTAVLGLGNIGPLAGKPVMEGKGCLFKNLRASTYSISSLPRATQTRSSRQSPGWSPPSAGSIWRTSRPRNASTLSRSCGSA